MTPRPPLPGSPPGFKRLLNIIDSEREAQNPFLSLEQSPAKDYQTMNITVLKEYAKEMGVEPNGDKRQRKSWIDALTQNSS